MTSSRSNRTEKPSEKEERERQRIEAANKRKGRAERRRADGTTPTKRLSGSGCVKVSEAYADTDSDPSEEMPLAARAAALRTAVSAPANIAEPNAPSPEDKEKPAPPVTEAPIPPPSSRPSPDTPSAADPAPPPPPARNDKKRSHKKKGRNQYTRDRDDDSPARSQSRDIQKDDHGTGSNRAGVDGHNSKSKAKGGMNSRVTMTDMKRRATALLDFISRTQVELAGETAPSPSDSKGDDNKINGDSTTTVARVKQVNGEAQSLAMNGHTGPAGSKDFKELSCMEMMDSLTRRLVKWQQEYSA